MQQGCASVLLVSNITILAGRRNMCAADSGLLYAYCVMLPSEQKSLDCPSPHATLVHMQ